MFLNLSNAVDLEHKFVYYITINTNIHLQRGDKMRKFVFILVVFMITVFAVDSAFGNAGKDDVKVSYNQVMVLKGETYWDIAGKYRSDGMTRKEYAEYIMEFNGAKNDSLKAGQRIIVPVIEYV